MLTRLQYYLVYRECSIMVSCTYCYYLPPTPAPAKHTAWEGRAGIEHRMSDSKISALNVCIRLREGFVDFAN